MSTSDTENPASPRKKLAASEACRLPLSDPDYRYPENSRNPYAEKLKLYGRSLHSGNLAELHPGEWLKRGFPAEQKGPLHVEIGCNAGHVIVEWAKRDPSSAYVGIDWKMKAIVRGAEKAIKHQRSNLTFLRAHADRLKFIFGPKEIDYLYLFFPDPWAKEKQLKHRFVTEENLRQIAGLMKPGGVFTIKTDHADYFEWMIERIEKVQDLWESFELTRDLHAAHPDPTSLEIPDVTLFERLFIRDRIPIKSVKLRRR